ncbi:ClpXP protease specificity-enhancing factor [Nitrosococcus oceani]|uniref:Stringent starvation protein B n=2 Tax=Nitrosococcus oceani TaxID=1229 RepID=Q3JEC2_NITOC|nr:ClpXP protease specificity-enhancing factor [Nitrosococcus oceani]KFI20777.1 peptidase [Nitrosococcus oceani C-27]ABA56824.1 Stringent starvation protein B [Nitrosococcus oceani ATCC 19707]EDZ66278.1 stringent starvation protein B [Nitrosococcus oceani AFC27]KFI23849.1 peptidase [Nitrosococcus oceani]GEM20581.1 stringent starvation protein B [Nitrosococcus oceani]
MADNSNHPMTSNRPYLIRALYQWIIDNDLTPHLLVDTTLSGVQIPQQHASEGKIILNIHPNSVRDLCLENDWISFSARFSGTSYKALFPVQAALAIYARENGQGMIFQKGDHDGDPPPPAPDEGGRKPSLRVVK